MATPHWPLAQGLSDPDDPDASLTDFTGRKRVWIEVGQPEDKAPDQGLQQGRSVIVYCFNHASEVWWKGIEIQADAPGKAPGLAHSYRSLAGHGGHGRAQHAAAGHGAGRRADLSSNLGSVHLEARALEVTRASTKKPSGALQISASSY